MTAKILANLDHLQEQVSKGASATDLARVFTALRLQLSEVQDALRLAEEAIEGAHKASGLPHMDARQNAALDAVRIAKEVPKPPVAARRKPMTPAQQAVLDALKAGARVVREGSPPYRWSVMSSGSPTKTLRDSVVQPLVDNHHVRMEETNERYLSHRLVLADADG